MRGFGSWAAISADCACRVGAISKQRSAPPDFRANSTGCLRLCAALAVIVAHSYVIGGFGADPISQHSSYAGLGEIAVFTFFCISGMLVSNSYIHCESSWRYAWHRVLRILPGYWVCLAVTALVLGPLMTIAQRDTIQGYWSAQVWRYVAANLWGINQWDITPLLDHVPHPGLIDGSLWTIHYELLCYVALGALGMCGMLLRGRVLFIAAMIYACAVCCHVTAPADASNEIVDAYTAFALGASIYALLAYIRLDNRLALVALLALSAGVPCPVGYLWTPLALAYLVYYSAYRLPAWTRGVNNVTDLSYGTYLYAYPLAQLLVLCGVLRLGHLAFLMATVGVVLPVAWASWLYVERPMLRLKAVRIWSPANPRAPL